MDANSVKRNEGRRANATKYPEYNAICSDLKWNH